jgi:bifunctional non-homologous end joining protein LigD
MSGKSAASRADSRLPSAARARLTAALDAAGESGVVEVEGHAIALTHLDRVYWPANADLHQPALTKRDFLRYLVAVAPALLPHVRDRPLTLFRWPEGIAGRRVLEKHWNITLPPFVERVEVFSDSKARTDQYILCNNLATLMWLAHMGTLEIHAWHSRVNRRPDAADAGTDWASSGSALEASILERPDYMLFDIDPFIYSGKEPKGREPAFNAPAFAKARTIAFQLEALLDGIGLRALVKTSGKTGLHVIVPIRRTLRFRIVREMAHFIGERLLHAHPHDITVDWAVDKRTGKVFLDTNMNVRGKSITAAYSPRGLAGAPVSMPLTWAELKDADPTDFRLTTVVPLLAMRGDAWAGWLDRKQSVEDRLAIAVAKSD